MPSKKDIVGNIYFGVKVLEELEERSPSRKIQYMVLCPVCNQPFKTIGNNLKSGGVRSCVPCSVKLRTTHGDSKTKFYNVWAVMKYRCKDLNNPNYGGRGITYCDSWEDYDTFKRDMFASYKEGLSIERVDNSKGYSKENCVWATPVEQSCNQRIYKRANKTSQYRYVSKNRSGNSWRAHIIYDNKVVFHKYFKDELTASKEADKFIIENKLPKHLNFEEK